MSVTRQGGVVGSNSVEGAPQYGNRVYERNSTIDHYEPEEGVQNSIPPAFLTESSQINVRFWPLAEVPKSVKNNLAQAVSKWSLSGQEQTLSELALSGQLHLMEAGGVNVDWAGIN